MGADTFEFDFKLLDDKTTFMVLDIGNWYDHYDYHDAPNRLYVTIDKEFLVELRERIDSVLCEYEALENSGT